MKKSFRIVFFGVFLILFSCSSDEDCVPTIIGTTNLELQYDCLSTTATVDIDLENTYTIIRNQDDYDTLVSGSCDVEIDFTRFDLLIGKEQLTTGFDGISYFMFLECEDNSLQLEISIGLTEAIVSPNITYHVLFPKFVIERDVAVTIFTN